MSAGQDAKGKRARDRYRNEMTKDWCKRLVRRSLAVHQWGALWTSVNKELFAMRETAMAFPPLVAVMYFMFFPSQLALCLQWLMRLVQ